ncbi:hypothetical protein Q5P01_000911 [Channa striata]|uniref:Uncharacterized protein n=1 Tax=Channa striata TaxID=64152 RepID=A0AA88IKE6_CHASR|nr:hypothetical protein Q5P01_000911 [Channa striata]
MISQEELDAIAVYSAPTRPGVGGSRPWRKQRSLRCLHGGLGQCGHGPGVACAGRMSGARGERSQAGARRARSDGLRSATCPSAEILAYLGELSRGIWHVQVVPGKREWKRRRFPMSQKPLRAGFEESVAAIFAREESTRGGLD